MYSGMFVACMCMNASRVVHYVVLCTMPQQWKLDV